MAVVDVIAGIIWNEGRFLICRRPPHKARGLLWEFPGGKRESGETDEQCLSRECLEELAVEIITGKRFYEVIHEYPDITIRLRLYEAEILQGKPKLQEHVELKWIFPHQIHDYIFCPADQPILKEIERRYQKDD